jgi:hypothetical protein
VQEDATRIISFVDRRWFTGASYLNNGFTLVSTTPPGYWYFSNLHRLSRFSFTKRAIKKRLAVYDDAKTERQNMLDNGYRIIHDCGNFKMQRVR